jgi:Concanavalin A-like lectin/glucanases superfamily
MAQLCRLAGFLKSLRRPTGQHAGATRAWITRIFYIGAYRGACNFSFAGDIDEVRVFNRALSAGEIQNIVSSTP